MRAAIISEIGGLPTVTQMETPAPASGQALVRIEAAALQPVELIIAAGRFYDGPPSVPYVPGLEGVGTVVQGSRLQPGQRVRVEIVHPGYGIDGCFAEYAVVDETDVVRSQASKSRVEPIDVELSNEMVAALGSTGSTARLLVDRAVTERGQLAGKHIAILGATGAVGEILTQICRLEGATRIVAVGRSRERLAHAVSLGADATVMIPERVDVPALTAEIAEAADGRLDLVFDPLWGDPAAAALDAVSVGGILVNFGQSAGPRAALSGVPLRARRVTIIGHAGARATLEELRTATASILEDALGGRISMTYDVVKLDAIADAWHRQAASPGTKLVIVP